MRAQSRKASGRRSWSGIGSVVCGLVLALCHLATVYLLFIAYVTEIEPWDYDGPSEIRIVSGLAVVVSVVTAGLTGVFVTAEWVHRRWYAVPVVCAAAGILRWVLLAPGR